MTEETQERMQKIGTDTANKLILDAATSGTPEQCSNQLYAVEVTGLHIVANMGANYVAQDGITIDEYLEQVNDNIRRAVEALVENIKSGKSTYLKPEDNQGPVN